MPESAPAQYPEFFCRGIINNNGNQFYYTSLDGNTISERPILRDTIFDKFTKPDPPRSDNFHELSINWVDDDGALDLLMNYKKGTEIHYKGGACKTALSTFTEWTKKYAAAMHLKYERQPLEENKYHGNILRSPDLRGDVFKVFALHLAENSIFLRNPNLETP